MAFLYKMEHWDKPKFMNEVLGLPCDESIKLLSSGDLQGAMLDELDGQLDNIRGRAADYDFLVLGVDWSGGGQLTDSYTALAVLGPRMRAGRLEVDVLFTQRLDKGMSPEEESGYIKHVIETAGCRYVAHDFTGAGYLREVMLNQSGVTSEATLPMNYTVSARADIVWFHEEQSASRRYYSLDKPRSLALLAAMIRQRHIRLHRFSPQQATPLNDLLALVEKPRENASGSVFYLIGRAANRPDDCAHAINFAANAIWYLLEAYPVLEQVDTRYKTPYAVVEEANADATPLNKTVKQ